jgi:hypothetical protein
MSTFYVDAVNGNNSNTGLSIAQAWATLAYAEGIAAPADTIVQVIQTVVSTADSVLDRIIQDVAANIVAAGSAAGFTTSTVLRDDYAVLNFPPDPEAEWVSPKGLSVVIQMPTGALEGEQSVNYDKFMQHFKCAGLCYVGTPGYQNAAAALTLSTMVEKTLKMAIKQLRGTNLANVTRNGYADNTLCFTYSRWSWGQGRGAGFTLEFDVIYRTAQNDPDTKG